MLVALTTEAQSTSAPDLSNIFVISTYPPCEAKNNAVVPVTRLALTSAPCSNSSITQFM